MDDADRTDERLETEMQYRISAAARAVHLPPTGVCYNCDEPLDGGMRWCDRDCLDDWQKRQKNRPM